MNKRRFLRTNLLVMLAISAALVSGCATRGQGAATADGIGALATQAVGADAKSALVGPQVGTGIGYVIGSETDKEKAQEMSRASMASDYTHLEVGPLGGTKWEVVEVTPKTIVREFISKIVEFDPEGRVSSTTTYPDRTLEVVKEHYRVVGDTLIVNRRGYLVNAKYSIRDGEMVVSAEKFRAVLRRATAFAASDLNRGDAGKGFWYDTILFRKSGEGDYWVSGEIENRSGFDYPGISFALTVYDGSNNVIGMNSFILKDFKKGTMRPFKTLAVLVNAENIGGYKIQYSLGRKGQ